MVKFLSNKPLILFFDNFLSETECDNIVNYPWEWIKSTGYDHDSESSKDTPIRTSNSVFLYPHPFKQPAETLVLRAKVASFLKISAARIEYLQLQRYNVGQEYKAHCDYFYSGKHTENNRVATLIIYLNDQFKGGGTSFPKLGVSTEPKKGSAVYFEYDYDNDTNLLTLHSGDPIIEGCKVIVTAWIRKDIWVYK